MTSQPLMTARPTNCSLRKGQAPCVDALATSHALHSNMSCLWTLELGTRVELNQSNYCEQPQASHAFKSSNQRPSALCVLPQTNQTVGINGNSFKDKKVTWKRIQKVRTGCLQKIRVQDYFMILPKKTHSVSWVISLQFVTMPLYKQLLFQTQCPKLQLELDVR